MQQLQDMPDLLKRKAISRKLGRYYYNLGNTMFESKKYQESVDAYKNALRNNPGDMDAKHNLQLATENAERATTATAECSKTAR